MCVWWPLIYYTLTKYSTSWFYLCVTVLGINLNSFLYSERSDKAKETLSGIGLLVIVLALDIWTFDKIWYLITAWLFLWFLGNCEVWREGLNNNRIIAPVGHLSFTLYLLHCPILYSVSMIIYRWFSKFGFSYFYKISIDFFLTTLAVITVSEVYYRLIQRRIDLLVNKWCYK